MGLLDAVRSPTQADWNELAAERTAAGFTTREFGSGKHADHFFLNQFPPYMWKLSRREVQRATAFFREMAKQNHPRHNERYGPMIEAAVRRMIPRWKTELVGEDLERRIKRYCRSATGFWLTNAERKEFSDLLQQAEEAEGVLYQQLIWSAHAIIEQGEKREQAAIDAIGLKKDELKTSQEGKPS